MNNKLILAAAASALCATPALAGSTYVGASGGAVFANSSKDKGAFTSTVPATPNFPAIPSGTPLTLKTKYKTGYNLSGVVGYRSDSGVRFEAEVAYSKSEVDRHRELTVGGANIDSFDVAVLTRGTPSASNPRVGAVIGNGGRGRTTNFSAFGNAYYDIPTGGAVQPYIGAGLGVSRVNVRYAPSNIPVAAGKQTKLAYQGIAGLTVKAGQGFELFTQYAYRGTGRVNIPLQIVPARWGVENRGSLLSLGFRATFGSHAD